MKTPESTPRRRRPAGGHLHIRPEDAPGTADQSRPQGWSWGALFRPLDESLRKTSSEPLPRRSLLQLRFYWLDGLFASLSENLYGTFVTLFALAYGATSGQIGLLSSVANLASTASLFPGARLVERTGRPRQLVVWSAGVAGRLPLALLALIPIVVRSPGALVWTVILLNGFRSFAMSFPNPAWTAMSAEIVPQTLRGRFFASKNVAMGVVAFIAGPLGGLLIRLGNRAGGSGVLGSFPGYQLVFMLSFLVGMVATVSFWKIPDTPFHRPEEGFRPRGMLRAITEVKVFPIFLVSGFVWNLGTMIAGPFFSVYMVQGLHATPAEVGMQAGMSALLALAGQYFFGRIVDRRGSVYVQLVTGFIIPLLPLPWIWATHPWHGLFMAGLGGFFWAGYNLANFNLVLELTPPRLRARATAVYQSVVFASSVIGPLIGGAVIDAAGFTPVWILTSVGRFLGAVIFAAGMGAALRVPRGERKR